MHAFQRTRTRDERPDAPGWFQRLAGYLGSKSPDVGSRTASGDPLLEFPAESMDATEGAWNAPPDSAEPFALGALQGWFTPRRAMLIAAALCLLIGGASLAIPRLLVLPVTAQKPRDGQLTIETRPSRLEVLLDGEPRGATPLTLAVPPGPHSVTIRNGSDERVVPLTIESGAEINQYFEMPVAERVSVSGRLSVVTDPPGARVSVDGRPQGISPVTVADLPDGQHRITVTTDGGSLQRTVTVVAGSTASVVFSLPKISGPVGGWLSVDAPFDVELIERQEVIGTTGATRTMLAAGQHDLMLANRTLGYQESRTVEIVAGKTTSIRVEPPKVPVSMNARPWAEIMMDGTSVGQTPIANMLVPLGSHEVVFRHPQFAEVRQTVIVTAKGPNRIAADLTK
jgi:hypothetical protein